MARILAQDHQLLMRYWGKARAGEASGPQWHPLVCHLLDVAACMEALLAARPVTRRRAATLLGLSESDACRLLVAMAVLHDVGKLAPRFQSLATPRGWQIPEALIGIDSSRFERSRHTIDGLLLWDEVISPQMSDAIAVGSPRALKAIRYAVFTHHGVPQEVPPFGAAALEMRFPPAVREMATACASELIRVLRHDPVSLADASARGWRVASWWVAGLMVLSDWIGSRTEWFPYAAPSEVVSLDYYWERARTQARVAVCEAGLESLHPPLLRTFAELTGRSIATPMQEWAGSVDISSDPTLFIVEDVTGAGKTEVASGLAHRLLHAGAASGVYWGMPTMATANAMYSRQLSVIPRLFGHGPRKPSLVLGHAQARLDDRFQSTIIRGPAPLPADASDESESSVVACPAFMADDRRASLLADVGAGTVDQMLLGVLPTRFNALRLFALAEKVLIVDEVHAFDVYMNTEIEALLVMQSALGGSAILLSATLPIDRRRRLERSWSRAEELGDGALIESTAAEAYPLATTVMQRREALSVPVAASPRSYRELRVTPVHRVEDCVARIVAAVKADGAVVWIRNTVAECLSGAALLRENGLTPLVFHGRFAQGDRHRIERDVLARFGAESSHERAGQVLVASQVVEQSLDVDFDLMVTDLAPIDLLLQRAGRLWRHHRENRFCEWPELVVLGPDPSAQITADWSKTELPGTRAVYRDVEVLWRTWQWLLDHPSWHIPAQLRTMIGYVYEEGSTLPPVLEAAALEHEGEEHAQRATAHLMIPHWADGYAPGRAYDSDLRARTRLGDAQIAVRLARIGENGRLRPWFLDDAVPEWQQWLLSEVKVRSGRFRNGLGVPPQWQGPVKELRRQWGSFEQDIPVLVLIEDGSGTFVGRLQKDAVAHVDLRYCPVVGLQY